jgi:hypothetical protein
MTALTSAVGTFLRHAFGPSECPFVGCRRGERRTVNVDWPGSWQAGMAGQLAGSEPCDKGGLGLLSDLVRRNKVADFARSCLCYRRAASEKIPFLHSAPVTTPYDILVFGALEYSNGPAF